MTHATAQLPTNIALLRQCPQPPPQADGFFPALGLNRAVTIESHVCAQVFIDDRVEEGPELVQHSYCTVLLLSRYPTSVLLYICCYGTFFTVTDILLLLLLLF